MASPAKRPKPIQRIAIRFSLAGVLPTKRLTIQASAQVLKNMAGVSGVMIVPVTANKGLLSRMAATKSTARRSAINCQASQMRTAIVPSDRITAGRRTPGSVEPSSSVESLMR